MPFVKGKSGNPGGKSKELKGIQELARVHCPAAIRTLVRIMNNPKAPAAAQALCANSILDRGLGKPVQALEHHIPAEFERFSDRELLEQLSRQANEMGVNVTLTYDFGEEKDEPRLIEGS